MSPASVAWGLSGPRTLRSVLCSVLGAPGSRQPLVPGRDCHLNPPSAALNVLGNHRRTGLYESVWVLQTAALAEQPRCGRQGDRGDPGVPAQRGGPEGVGAEGQGLAAGCGGAAGACGGVCRPVGPRCTGQASGGPVTDAVLLPPCREALTRLPSRLQCRAGGAGGARQQVALRAVHQVSQVR